jgi:N-acetylmuramoyl-L-alanine amidase
MFGARRMAFAAALVLALAATSPLATFARATSRRASNENSAASDRHQQAEAQFDIAEAMRQSLESNTATKPAEEQYKRVVSAYRRVYLLTASDKDVPAAIMAVGDLYREMAERFGGKYWQSAVDAYDFLLHDYPTSKFREDALWNKAQIQKEGLKDSAAAQKSFEQFLQLHPRSSHAADAKAALAELNRMGTAPTGSTAVAAAAKNERASQGSQKKAANARVEGTSAAAPVVRQPEIAETVTPPAFTPTQITPAEKMEEPTSDKPVTLTDVKSWTTPDYSRLVIEVSGPVKYQSARIENPPRIYFDVSKARLAPQLLRGQIAVQGDLLKGVRVAQNQDGVVRVVIEIAKIRDYAVYLLRDPYRMVVDVYPKAATLSALNHWAPKSNGSAIPHGGTNPFAPPKQVALPLTTEQRERAADAMLTATELKPPAAPLQQQTGVSVASPKTLAKTEAIAAPQPIATIKTARNSKLAPPPEAEPNMDGGRSLTRALGLKIGRIVIDAGHGGYDTGTVGPSGLMEKDLCLDVALRLGKLIQEKLPSAEVIYTRTDDTFIPLEQRTQIANDAKADMFISIHANSSPDHAARGVETYYLNFSASPGAMEVASRENALAQENVHDLEDMVQRIARNEKIEESKDLASDIQTSLSTRLRKSSPSIRDRGVRKAPFVVLIGANMPSVLAEISFISNPTDESLLKKGDNREHVAEGLYHGVEAYLQSINSLAANQTKLAGTSVASNSSHPASSGNQR